MARWFMRSGSGDARRSRSALSTKYTVVIGDYWGDLIRVDLPTSQISRAQIAENGISSIARSGEYLVATSYDGGIYLVEPSSLKVLNTLRAMTQRVRPTFAQAG